MKKVIISGASGFVGGALTRDLIGQGVEVVAIVRPNSNNRANLQGHRNLKVVECDLESLERLNVKALNKAEVFYHLAWEGSAGDARSDEKIQLKNVQYSVNAVRLAKRIGCQKFIGVGSIMEKEAYWASNEQGNKLNTAYIYGMAKLTAHCLTKAVAAEIKIDHLWPMITNAYGVGEKSPRFINTTLRKIILGEKLEFTAGTQNYDFIYIDDVAYALRLLGQKGMPFCQYILGSGQAQMLKKFIKQIGATLTPGQKIIFGDIPYTGVNLELSEFSIENLVKDTGFTINVPFTEGIKKTFKYLKEEEEAK